MTDPLERLGGLLEAEPEALDRAVERLDRLIAQSPEASRRLGIVPVSGDGRLASARFAAELLGDAEALRQRPSFEQDVAVMEWVLRPAIPYEGLGLAAEAGIWPELADIDLDVVARRCCRIDLGRSWSQRVHFGSGFFLTGCDASAWVVTAAHVASALEQAGWSSPGEGPRAWAWCGAEEPADAVGAFELLERARTHPGADLSILAVPSQEDDAAIGPGLAAEVEAGSLIAVCGYPYFDSRRDSWARAYGFREPASSLRISPGMTRRLATRTWMGSSLELIEHDAATLSGSSGSLVVGLPDLRLVGVHVGGWPSGESDGPFEANVAVPQRLIADLL